MTTPQQLQQAIERVESEMGEWGSIAMRLSDEQLADLRIILSAIRKTNKR